MNAELLRILACPDDQGALEAVQFVNGEGNREVLVCQTCGREYRIDDIPVML